VGSWICSRFFLDGESDFDSIAYSGCVFCQGTLPGEVAPYDWAKRLNPLAS